MTYTVRLPSTFVHHVSLLELKLSGTKLRIVIQTNGKMQSEPLQKLIKSLHRRLFVIYFPCNLLIHVIECDYEPPFLWAEAVKHNHDVTYCTRKKIPIEYDALVHGLIKSSYQHDDFTTRQCCGSILFLKSLSVLAF